jgi:fido (protein-threonine AMPylation protein)
MEAGLSEIFGDVCETVGKYVERVAEHESDKGSSRFDPYKISDLLEVHKDMFGGVIQNAGLFRTVETRVMRGAQVAFVPPAPSESERMTNDLFEWLRDSGEHPLVAFAIFHYQLLFLHPFNDGNGRIARLWHSLLLEKWRPALGVLRIEELVEGRKSDYLLSLERSDRQKSVAPFVQFMLSLIGKELAGVLEGTLPAPVKAAAPEAPARLSDFFERLLSVFGERTLTGADIMKGLSMSHRGTFRKNYLDPSIEAGYVEMTQPDSPRSPTQKYRLTPLGREAAQKIG